MSPFQDEPTPPDIGPLYEPDPILFSFEAPGWTTVGALLFLGLLAFSWMSIRRHRRRHYRREGVRRLERLAVSRPKEHIYEVSRILKSVAIQTYGRRQVAALSGKEWSAFLNRTGMPSGCTEHLMSHYCASGANVVPMKVLAAAKTWILHHA